MSEELFSKIDALMNRHRPGAPLPSGGGYLPLHPVIPTLTEVIEEPQVAPPVPEQAPAPVPAESRTADLFTDQQEIQALPLELPDALELNLDEASLAILERRLRTLLENRVAVQVARRVDLAMGEMLEGLRGEIEHMIHDAVEQELKQFAAHQLLKQTRLE